MLDGLLIACALLFLSWSLILSSLGHTTDVGTAAGIVTFAYPFGDVVLLFFIVLTIRGMRGGHRVSLWCLLGGLVAMAVADSAYAFAGAQGYASGQAMDVAWIVGYLAIGLGAIAARLPAPAMQMAESRSPTLAVLAVPFVVVLAALAVAAAKMQTGSGLDAAALVMLGALIVLTLARQALLVREFVAASGTRTPNASARLISAATGNRKAKAPMAGHEGRVSLRQDYGSRAGAGPTRYVGVQKPVSRGDRFGLSVVVTLLVACTSVAILDLVLMLGALH